MILRQVNGRRRAPKLPVSGESSEERYEQIHYKASFATIHEEVFTVENIISV